MRLISLLGLCLVMLACRHGGDATVVPDGASYDVTLTRTSLGIPHIRSHREGDFGSLGYGYGYAFAQDNLCELLDDMVTIRGERARFFGPSGSYTIYANGSVANNVDSDYFWKSVATDEAIAPMRTNMLPEAMAGSRGFADGFNRYLREIKAGGDPGRHLACRDGEWLRELTVDDMLRRYFRLGLLASSSVFVDGVAKAQPPTEGAPAPTALSAAQMADALRADPGPLKFFTDPDLGSNMYAIGKDASATGMPIVFGNPHFPWKGTERLYLAHLTVPGRTNIMGVGLYGVPLALIGFNEHFAWSHTVSTAYRFTFYELTLAPDDPTSYIYEGEVMKMAENTITIEVKNPDGTIGTRSRTLYRSKYGPMLYLNVSGANIFPWSTSKAYTLRDANAENDRLINHFFRWNMARSLDEFKQIQRETVAVPWVNTVASGPGGKAYYADITTVPHVTDAKAQTCGNSSQAQALAAVMPGLYVLDGSMASCEWGTDADAPAPGIFGAGNLPSLERNDWVGNNNDSYWLTHPAQPITGYNRIIGAENTTRSLRTRNSILKQFHRADGSDGRAGTQWTTEQLKHSVLDSSIYSADIALADVLSDICPLGTVNGANGPVNIGPACAVLANWDRSNNRDSVGGHIWREFWRRAAGVNGFYMTPYSGADPVNTPRDINTSSPQVQQALADAVTRLQSAGIAMDARLGSIQHAWFDPSIEIFGGEGNLEGAFTIARGPLTNGVGYPIDFGNSYMQVVTWEADGEGYRPVADAFVTYSQSIDPTSPNHRNFSREYSAKNWKRLPFQPDEIQRDKVSEVRLTN